MLEVISFIIYQQNKFSNGEQRSLEVLFHSSLGANCDLWCAVSLAKKPKTIDSSLLEVLGVGARALRWICVTRCKVNLRQEKQSPQTRLPRCRRPGLCRRMHTFTSPPSTFRLYMCVCISLYERVGVQQTNECMLCSSSSSRNIQLRLAVN
jgi:hypothetical protein